jgi:hypothetical protein
MAEASRASESTLKLGCWQRVDSTTTSVIMKEGIAGKSNYEG